MAVKHPFVSAKPAGSDASLVQPANWNADHLIASGSVEYADLAADARGIDYLGGVELGVDAGSTGALAISARDMLMVNVRLTGRSAATIIGLRFNGDAAANYWWAGIRQKVAAPTTFEAFEGTGVTAARLHNVAETTHMSALVLIHGGNATAHVGSSTPSVATQSLTAPPLINAAGFTHIQSPAAPITSIELLTITAGVLMSAGTAFGVWGKNL